MTDILEPLKKAVAGFEKEQKEVKGQLTGAWLEAANLAMQCSIEFAGEPFAYNEATGHFYAWVASSAGLVIEVISLNTDPVNSSYLKVRKKSSDLAVGKTVGILRDVPELPPFGLYAKALAGLKTFIADYTAEVLNSPTRLKEVTGFVLPRV